MSPRLSNLLTALLVGSALVVTGLVARRELFAPAPQAPVTRLVGWERLASAGHRTGPAAARVTIVEFSDFQCPFCARAQPELRRMLREHPRDLALVFRHYPLTNIHPHARVAALAAECAGEQGRFTEYHDILFSRQDSIGHTSWGGFARAAGVPDTAAFDRCLAGSRTAPIVAADMKQGEELGLNGTPVFVINGRVVSGAPTAEAWDRLMRDAMADRNATPVGE